MPWPGLFLALLDAGSLHSLALCVLPAGGGGGVIAEVFPCRELPRLDFEPAPLTASWHSRFLEFKQAASPCTCAPPATPGSSLLSWSPRGQLPR